MLDQLRQLFQSAWQLSEDRHDGDALLRKIDAIGEPISPELEERLAAREGNLFTIDMKSLRQLPDGTLGREYARYMDENKLQPVVVSEEVEEIARRNAFATRYLLTHDLLHLLTGFPDNSYAGEIGLLAFSVEQGYGEEQERALKIAEILYPMLAPNEKEAIEESQKRGSKMGREADFVLAYPFEKKWDRPLREVCEELGLPPLKRRTS